ncbi:MAG: TIGR04338 family metallohydrolase [Actinomycetales bacterium]
MDRDADRSRVYAVEDAWSAVLDRGGLVDFFGSRLQVPCQRRFGDLSAMQAYADFCLSSTRRTLPQVTVRRRRGQQRAHYQPADPVDEIAIPLQARWACRESVLLHEIAHHVTRCLFNPGSMHHGPRFRGAMCWLAGLALGPEATLLLRTGYQGAGLEVVNVP